MEGDQFDGLTRDVSAHDGTTDFVPGRVILEKFGSWLSDQLLRCIVELTCRGAPDKAVVATKARQRRHIM